MRKHYKHMAVAALLIGMGPVVARAQEAFAALPPTSSPILAGCEPEAGTPSVDFIAVFPTANLHLRRQLWSRQIEKSYDSCQSEAAVRACKPNPLRVAARMRPAPGEHVSQHRS